MAVIAIFKYDVKPGRLPDFMKKLGEAAAPKFNSDVMPKSVRMLRSTVPGPDHGVILLIEYDDMAAYGARTTFENANPEWRQLFEPTRDSPETLVSVELLTELPPPLPDTESERLTFGFRPARET
jgi:NIPSNAP